MKVIRIVTVCALLGLSAAACSSVKPAVSAAAPSAAATDSQGVTASTIKIGIMAPINSKAAIEAFAAVGLSVGNVPLEATTIGNYINAHGGIDGRKVVFADFPYNMLAPSEAAEDEAACTYWIQDQRVFAAIMPYNVTDQQIACLAQGDTPLIEGLPGRLGDPSIMKTYNDFYFSPSDPPVQSWVTTMVNAYLSDGFFAPDTKIGVVSSGDPQWTYAESLMAGILAQHGQKVAADAVVGTSAQAQAAALRFKSAGVNRVVIFDSSSGGETITWMTATAGEHYYPEVGFNSEDNPGGLTSTIPISAFAGSQGVGWRPVSDVDYSRQPPANATTALCLNLFAAAGEKYTNQLDSWTALSFCDGLLSLQAALKGAKVINPQTLTTGYQSLGTSYTSALTFKTDFGPGRHAAAAEMESFAFNAGCKCMVYTGHFYPLTG